MANPRKLIPLHSASYPLTEDIPSFRKALIALADTTVLHLSCRVHYLPVLFRDFCPLIPRVGGPAVEDLSLTLGDRPLLGALRLPCDLIARDLLFQDRTICTLVRGLWDKILLCHALGCGKRHDGSPGHPFQLPLHGLFPFAFLHVDRRCRSNKQHRASSEQNTDNDPHLFFFSSYPLRRLISNDNPRTRFNNCRLGLILGIPASISLVEEMTETTILATLNPAPDNSSGVTQNLDRKSQGQRKTPWQLDTNCTTM